jgi:hypothetical protein
VGDNKFSISIPPNRAADSLIEWLKRNVVAMASMTRYSDLTIPPRKRRTETEMKQKVLK